MAVLKDWRSWHSPEMVLLTSVYTASSLQPLIPSGRPSPKHSFLLFSWLVCTPEPSLTAAKELDYASNNAQLSTLTPALENASPRGRLKAPRDRLRC